MTIYILPRVKKILMYQFLYFLLYNNNFKLQSVFRVFKNLISIICVRLRKNEKQITLREKSREF